MQELSQWFNLSEQMPWEPGVYELKGQRIGSAYSWFDGGKFMYTWDASVFGIRDAFGSREDNTQPPWFHSLTHWRGLSSDHSPNTSPKPRGNRRVTRYVVMDWMGEPLASFSDGNIAAKYAASIRGADVKKIRFRTPEASQSKEN